MATLKIQGLQNPLPSFSFPFIAPAPNGATYLDPPYPGVELPSFTLGTSPSPNPISMVPVEPLPGGAGDPGYGFGMSG